MTSQAFPSFTSQPTCGWRDGSVFGNFAGSLNLAARETTNLGMENVGSWLAMGPQVVQAFVAEANCAALGFKFKIHTCQSQVFAWLGGMD